MEGGHPHEHLRGLIFCNSKAAVLCVGFRRWVTDQISCRSSEVIFYIYPRRKSALVLVLKSVLATKVVTIVGSVWGSKTKKTAQIQPGRPIAGPEALLRNIE